MKKPALSLSLLSGALAFLLLVCPLHTARAQVTLPENPSKSLTRAAEALEKALPDIPISILLTGESKPNSAILRTEDGFRITGSVQDDCVKGAYYLLSKAEDWLSAPVGAQASGRLYSPLMRIRESGDPCVLWDEETGYYYATYSSGRSDRITLYRARTLGDLGNAEGREIYVTGDACWQEKEIMSYLYAPELHKMDGKWYIYFSGSPISLTGEGKEKARVGVRLFCLECDGDDPWNDYSFKGCLNESLRAIDASVFTLGGQSYALCAEIVPGMGNVITIGRLKNPWTMEGDPVRIAHAEYDWELMDGMVNEGPWFFTGPTGRHFLLYSANNVNSYYYCLNILELSGEDPMDASQWVKRPETTFATYGTAYCPGHGCVFMSPDGREYYLAYHVKQYRNGSGSRQLQIQPLFFDADGAPILDRPLESSEYFFAPSGE